MARGSPAPKRQGEPLPAKNAGRHQAALAIGAALRHLKDLCHAEAAGFCATTSSPALPLIHLPRRERPALGKRLKHAPLTAAAIESALRAAGYASVLLSKAEWLGRRRGYVYIASRTTGAFKAIDPGLPAVFGQHAALALAAEVGAAPETALRLLSDLALLPTRTSRPAKLLDLALGVLSTHLRPVSAAAYLLRKDATLRLCARRGAPIPSLRPAALESLTAAKAGGSSGVSAWPLVSNGRPLAALALAWDGPEAAAQAGEHLSAAVGLLSAVLENALLHKDVREKARQLAGTASALKGQEAREGMEELKDSFLSGITHDLKTPLVPVIGLIRLMAGGRVGEVSQRQTEYLSICLRNLDKQLNLIDDLIDYMKARGGLVELRREPLDLREAVAGSLDMLEVMAKGRGIGVEADLGPEPLNVWADLGKLGRVLGNLFSNAVAFNREGGRVRVALSREHDLAVIEVSDTGVGIAAGDLPRIFERFYKAGAGAGSGLGLSVVKALVEAHGGEISATSTPGQGSCFRVCLGLHRPEAPKGGEH
jgi:signal transduction histidine kinase